MDLHQLANPVFLALLGAILSNSAIGATAIPHLVDKYVHESASLEARASVITRVRRTQHLMVALQIFLACTVAHCGQTLFQFALGAYVSLDAYLAIRVNRQAAQIKKIIR